MEQTYELKQKKRGFLFYTSIYRKILIQDLKSKMSYRADFIISTIGMIMTNLSGFVTFLILFRNFPSINGWDYHHMLFLYGFSLIALFPAFLSFSAISASGYFFALRNINFRATLIPTLKGRGPSALSASFRFSRIGISCGQWRSQAPHSTH